MKVKELREALKGVPGHLNVYTRDHDHSKYETNSIASYAEVLNQKDATGYERERLDKNPEFKIAGKYFVISA